GATEFASARGAVLVPRAAADGSIVPPSPSAPAAVVPDDGAGIDVGGCSWGTGGAWACKTWSSATAAGAAGAAAGGRPPALTGSAAGACPESHTALSAAGVNHNLRSRRIPCMGMGPPWPETRTDEAGAE